MNKYVEASGWNQIIRKSVFFSRSLVAAGLKITKNTRRFEMPSRIKKINESKKKSKVKNSTHGQSAVAPYVRYSKPPNIFALSRKKFNDAETDSNLRNPPGETRNIFSAEIPYWPLASFPLKNNAPSSALPEETGAEKSVKGYKIIFPESRANSLHASEEKSNFIYNPHQISKVPNENVNGLPVLKGSSGRASPAVERVKEHTLRATAIPRIYGRSNKISNTLPESDQQRVREASPWARILTKKKNNRTTLNKDDDFYKLNMNLENHDSQRLLHGLDQWSGFIWAGGNGTAKI